MNSSQPNWRLLTSEELALEPNARLRGTLVAIFIAALIPTIFFTVNVVALLVWVMADQNPSMRFLNSIPFLTGYAQVNSVIQNPVRAGLLASVGWLNEVLFYGWFVAIVVVTLARKKWGPRFVSLILVLWVISGMIQGMILNFLQRNPFSAILILIDPLQIASIILAIVFWTYMHEGRQPNIYFRPRVRME